MPASSPRGEYSARNRVDGTRRHSSCPSWDAPAVVRMVLMTAIVTAHTSQNNPQQSGKKKKNAWARHEKQKSECTSGTEGNGKQHSLAPRGPLVRDTSTIIVIAHPGFLGKSLRANAFILSSSRFFLHQLCICQAAEMRRNNSREKNTKRSRSHHGCLQYSYGRMRAGFVLNLTSVSTVPGIVVTLHRGNGKVHMYQPSVRPYLITMDSKTYGASENQKPEVSKLNYFGSRVNNKLSQPTHIGLRSSAQPAWQICSPALRSHPNVARRIIPHVGILVLDTRRYMVEN